MGNWTSVQQQKFPLKRRQKESQYGGFGWKPDLPDNRDIMAYFPADVKPSSASDLRRTEFMPDIYNQGKLGSCTANALVAAFEFDQRKQKLEDFLPSRQFLYYNERVIEGTTDYDSGASIRDGIKVLNRLGVCPEYDCPYAIDFFTERPSDKAYVDAGQHKAVNYRRLRVDVDEVTKALSNGIPVVFGFTVYESFESPDVARTGIMPIPSRNEKVLGGHAVMAVGHDSKRRFLLIRNSWGPEWGQKGYFWMPYDFFTPKNCSDVWIIQRVKDTKTEKVEVSKPVVKETPKKEEPTEVVKVDEDGKEVITSEEVVNKVGSDEKYNFKEDLEEEDEDELIQEDIDME